MLIQLVQLLIPLLQNSVIRAVEVALSFLKFLMKKYHYLEVPGTAATGIPFTANTNALVKVESDLVSIVGTNSMYNNNNNNYY